VLLRPDYPLETERLLLRPFTLDDLDALHAIESREDVTRYLYWMLRTREQVRRKLVARARLRTLTAEGQVLNLAMVLRGSGQMAGDASLRWISREHRQGEIGIVLHPDFHRRGLAGEASLVLLRLGFDELGLHRIIGRCDGRNTASATVLERLGMRREAHLRQNELVKGSGRTSSSTPCSWRNGGRSARRVPAGRGERCNTWPVGQWEERRWQVLRRSL